VEAKQLKFVN